MLHEYKFYYPSINYTDNTSRGGDNIPWYSAPGKSSLVCFSFTFCTKSWKISPAYYRVGGCQLPLHLSLTLFRRGWRELQPCHTSLPQHQNGSIFRQSKNDRRHCNAPAFHVIMYKCPYNNIEVSYSAIYAKKLVEFHAVLVRMEFCIQTRALHRNFALCCLKKAE